MIQIDLILSNIIDNNNNSLEHETYPICAYLFSAINELGGRKFFQPSFLLFLSFFLSFFSNKELVRIFIIDVYFLSTVSGVSAKSKYLSGG